MMPRKKDKDKDMNFLEWIKKTGRKMIITDRLSSAQKLLRKANRESGIDKMEVSHKTLLQIAEELLLAKWAFEDVESVPQIISAEAGVYIIDAILRTKKYGFVPMECYCLRTSEELLRNIMQIRMNETTEAYAKETGTKLSEIKDMIAVYETELAERNCMDEPMVLSAALAALQEMDTEELFLYLPWLLGCQVGILQDMEPSAVEQAFMEKLFALAAIETECLAFCEEAKDAVEYHFFSAYGVANEVRYVVNQIGEKRLAFGEVNLFYMDTIYENFIKAIFEKKGIPYAFVTGESIASANLVRLMTDIIDWATSDYLYKKLNDVVENPLLTFSNVWTNEDKKREPLVIDSPVNGFNHFLRKGIGWGKERYLECVRRVGKDETEREKYKLFRNFLRELAEIFEVGLSAEMLYERLFDFTMKYTYSQSMERKNLKAVLEEQKMVFAQVASQESVEEMLHLIKERLLGLTVKEKDETTAVGIYKISSVEVLERPYNYFIGLSAKQFAADTTESPVLSDEELQTYLRGNIKLATEAGSRLRENLRRSINTLTSGCVVMGYSTFDTVELKESSPSVFYLDYKDRKGADALEDNYCGYEIERDGLLVSTNVSQTATSTEDMKDTMSVSMSSSGLQTLTKCPLSYYYHYIKMLPSIEFQEKMAHQWLTAAAKGNLFHRTMERYCEEVIMKWDSPKEDVDENTFERIFEAAVTEMLEELPYVSEAVFRQEKENERANAWNYLCQFQKSLYDDGQTGIYWKILGCELDFKEVSYKVTDKVQVDKTVEVLFNGSIDRLEGFMKNGILYLRIVDYKTGDMSKLDAKIKNNTQLQHFIYAMAAKQYVDSNKEKLEELFGEEIKTVELYAVWYVFPNESILDKKDLVVNAMSGNEYRLPQEVDDIIWGLLGNLYCVDKELAQDYMDEFANNMEVKKDGTRKKEEPEACRYCKYKRQCRRKIGMEL